MSVLSAVSGRSLTIRLVSFLSLSGALLYWLAVLPEFSLFC